MKSDRLALFGVAARNKAAMERKKEARRRSEASRLKQHESSSSKYFTKPDRENHHIEETLPPQISLYQYTCINSLRHFKRLSVVSVATRLNINPAQQVALT
ncbi:unnamed protein product [Lepeophtheirus salmonis]|uniref:(salmon louse) hypothetical protein n=1 Tax=Lepeophtheirus salmonis TaxID=72036 RepID=A0A7R8CY25_LEPSM|nr:unnamed protein product [Lepeophtheirus salmonis]CAF2920456.1 unnamed protein product [Lepeophtheirus salmonis]